MNHLLNSGPAKHCGNAPVLFSTGLTGIWPARTAVQAAGNPHFMEDHMCNGRQDVREEQEAGESYFGEVIFAYSRKQALADGVLVDVSEMATEAGIRYPTAVTRAVWNGFVEVPEAVPWQDAKGRLWDILWMFRCRVAQGDCGEEVRFELIVQNVPGEPQPVTLKAVCGPGDEGEPVITIMLPEED